MINLTKGQKFIIVLTGLWECFLLVDSSAGRSRVRWDEFFVLSLPFILYWSGVWIFGFGYILNVLEKIKMISFMRWFLSFWYILGKSLLKTGVYALIVIFILWEITQFIKSFSDRIRGVSTSDSVVMDPEAQEIAYDYGQYYGLFVWQNNFCTKKGVRLTNLDIVRKKYETEIKHLESRWKNIKDKKGRSVEDALVKTGKLDEIANTKGYEGFKYFRKFAIVEKLGKQNPGTAFKYLKNLSEDDVLYKYGSLVTEKQACEYFNRLLPELINDDGNPFSQWVRFLNKYSFNLVLDNN